MIMRRRVFLHWLAALAVSSQAQRRGRGRVASIEASIDSIAEAALKELGIPGLSVALMRGDAIVASKGYGLADVERKIPASPETVYQIGSISKQFTAAAVMRLAESGKVRLDDPLTKHIPNYPTQGHDLRIRHLLHQTSGVKEFLVLKGFEELETGPPEKYKRDDLVKLFSKEPFHFPPGERWAYSNSNYTLLGVVIERASGKSYERFLQETFFQPLGLSSLHSCDARPSNESFAKGYFVKDGAASEALSMNMNTAIGDGGLCSNVLDLARWGRALVSGRVVSRASFRRMTSSERVRGGYKPAYGYGLSLVPLEGRRRIGHNGETRGFAGALAFYPEDDLTVAVLTNRSLIWPETIEKSLARAALKLPAPVVRDLPMSAERRAAYVGSYDFGVFPLRVIEEDARLKFDMSMGRPPYALLYQGRNAFVAERDPDAIRLFFNARADEMVIEMAGMHWYARRMK